ncbi:divalent-cation tolerance protein CutA [Halovivax limisalsi]|uniref:divalent-cation tolerance protein CutA n=1 Tax=Halovivax limisalsi TaxID=1453760 RepID=UPI001FFD2799|nr:divalent-cation tolerance protein CutA [Halovivax limisalsi]
MRSVYLTAPPEAADELARSIVERRLAACVNTISCESVYRWEGELVDDDEVVLIAKTTTDRAEDLTTYVRDHHPHDVPCIEQFEPTAVLDPYAEWCRRSVEEPIRSDDEPTDDE